MRNGWQAYAKKEVHHPIKERACTSRNLPMDNDTGRGTIAASVVMNVI